MKILAIETSCDDTSVALIEGNKEKVTLLKEAHASQIDVHKVFGGVVPEVAARKHTEAMTTLLKEVYDKNDLPDAIAVTAGPGLLTSLLVGVEAAKTVSSLSGIPLIRVNHMEGHIYSNWIEDPLQATSYKLQAIEFPVLALIVSGGHTELVMMDKHLSYKKIGATVDDAAGECFDKVGKLIGLEYPGGPKISKLAEKGDPQAIDLPRPMIKSDDLNFSFSGLKTAAKIYIEKHQRIILSEESEARANEVEGSREVANSDEILRQAQNDKIADFAASLEQAIVDVLVSKTLRAIKKHKPKTVVLGGGVAANKKLRETLTTSIEALPPFQGGIKGGYKTKFIAPHIPYCMDNAAMIGAAAYFKSQQNNYSDWKTIKADPVWELPN